MKLSAEKLLEEARILREYVGDVKGRVHLMEMRLDDLIQDCSCEILKGKNFDAIKKEFMKSGCMHKIAAIKSIRGATGLGLKEAKDVIEKWEEERNKP